MPVVKEIVAVPGDRVRVERSGLAVNGRELAGAALLGRDTHGRPLPHVRLGQHRLGEDELWVLGPASPRSWDSRYFGPIATAQVVATVQPWLTW
jgi:conjugative transfer signal peptidase TraF